VTEISLVYPRGKDTSILILNFVDSGEQGHSIETGEEGDAIQAPDMEERRVNEWIHSTVKEAF
jgi:hypothetical protein